MLKPEHDSYRLPIENLPDAFAYHQMILDDHGNPVDYIIVEVNQAYEEMVGLKREEIIGKKATEIYPGIDNSDFDWVGTYGRVALTSEPTRFVRLYKPYGRWYDISAYSDKPGYFAATFRDISEQKKTEQALRESEEKYQVLFNTFPLGITVSDQYGKIIESNDLSVELLGIAKEEHETRHINGDEWRIIRPDGTTMPSEEYASVRALKENRLVENIEMGIVKPDAEITWINVTAAPIPLENHGITIAYSNITDRKQAEIMLAESETKYRQLVENTHDIIYSLTPEGLFTYVSPAWSILLGHPTREVEGHLFAEFVHPDDLPACYEFLQKVVKTGQRQEGVEYRVQHISGTWRWHSSSGTPTKNKDGLVTGYEGIARDITERKLAEDRLQRINFSIENLSESIFWVGESGRFTDVNIAACRKLGYTREELLTMSVADIDPNFPPEQWAPHWEEMKQCGLKVIEAMHRAKDGNLIPMELVIHNQLFGNERYNIVIGHDITERKKAEMQIKKMAEIVDIAPNSITVHDAAGNFIYANEHTFNMHGYNKDEFLALNLKELDTPESAELIAPRMKVIEEKGEASFEVEHRKKDGSTFPLQIYVKKIDWFGQLALLSIATDITDRKQAKQALQERETRFQRMLKVIPDMVTVHDPDMNILYSNWCGFAAVPPEKQILNTKCYKTYHGYDQICPDCRAVLALESKKPLHDVFEFSEGCWFDLRIIPLLDSNGDVEFYIEWVRDISDLKKIEKELKKFNVELEEKVKERTAQLEASYRELDAFSYSVSHDLRGPLNRIGGFSQALLEDYSSQLDQQGQDYLRRIGNSSRQMTELIDDLLKLSKVSRMEINHEPVEISALVNVCLKELQAREPQRNIEILITPGLIVEGDTTLLRIVLENLIGNAWKYSGQVEKAKIEFGLTEQTGRSAYYIRDNGAGFDMKYAGKLFTAFQRLHSEQEFAGTGIGLSIVSRIIKRHGGEVWAEGEPGKGACFYFTLP